MKSKFLFFFLFALSCSSDYSPKSRGYFYIELPDPVYHDFIRYPFFKYSVSDQVIVTELKDESLREKEKSPMEFIMNYPRFQAHILCSYFKINSLEFSTLSEENSRMISVLGKKAKEIKAVAYNHSEQNVYGLVYELNGNLISPLQFVISDSIHSYFRGVLYFDTVLDRDSIAPVLTYISKDIQVMIESFQWKQ